MSKLTLLGLLTFIAIIYIGGIMYYHKKHDEKIQARPNYVVEQDLTNNNGIIELTTDMYYYPNAKEDYVVNIGKSIYRNTIEVETTDIESVKEKEKSIAEKFKQTHKNNN